MWRIAIRRRQGQVPSNLLTAHVFDNDQNEDSCNRVERYGQPDQFVHGLFRKRSPNRPLRLQADHIPSLGSALNSKRQHHFQKARVQCIQIIAQIVVQISEPIARQECGKSRDNYDVVIQKRPVFDPNT